MLDQSFSINNFRTIIYTQNRKGVYVEKKGFFENDPFVNSRQESNKIIAINASIKDERLRLINDAKARRTKFDFNAYQTFKNSFTDLKKEIFSTREQILEEILVSTISKVNHKTYKVGVIKGNIESGKQLFTTNPIAEDFFVVKQIQYNIKKSFKIQPANRPQIISQIVTLFQDKFPKVIIRADIDSFYESIPHYSLLQKINANNVLSHLSKTIIKDILNKYWNTLVSDGTKLSTDMRVGIPRGIGISAYLSEIYLRDFDNAIKSTPNVTYYARYVDDIIVVFTPKNRNEDLKPEYYKDLVIDTLEKKTSLQAKANKTEIVDLRPSVASIKSETTWLLTFLGYKFIFKYRQKNVIDNGITKTVIHKEPLEIRMSNNRRFRYLLRINKVFSVYNSEKLIYLKKANRNLIKRIKFLTGNTKLTGNKAQVLVGIYFSNLHLTEPYEDLNLLNASLQSQITTLLHISPYLRSRLRAFDFKIGYNQKCFTHYDLEKLRSLLSIWK